MIFVNTTPQTLAAAGDAVVFNTNTQARCNPNIRHRIGSGIITVRGSGCACNPARYRVSFHGNITGVAGQVQLGIYLNGELLPETVMSVFAAAASNVISVDDETEITADFGDSTISVRTLTPGITVNTASLIVERKA